MPSLNQRTQGRLTGGISPVPSFRPPGLAARRKYFTQKAAATMKPMEPAIVKSTADESSRYFRSPTMAFKSHLPCTTSRTKAMTMQTLRRLAFWTNFLAMSVNAKLKTLGPKSITHTRRSSGGILIMVHNPVAFHKFSSSTVSWVTLTLKSPRFVKSPGTLTTGVFVESNSWSASVMLDTLSALIFPATDIKTREPGEPRAADNL